jgi:hypothetical protein
MSFKGLSRRIGGALQITLRKQRLTLVDEGGHIGPTVCLVKTRRSPFP